MTGSARLNALLALEDPSTARATAGLLLDRGWNVEIARGKAVLSALESGSPNVAVLEFDGDEPSWADLQEVCTRLEERPQLLVVCAPGDVYQVLQLPARSHAYASRPAGPNLIAAQAEALAHGVRSNLDACLCAGGIALDPVARQVYLPGSAMKLPKREFDLLHLLMSRRGEVVTREEAVRHLFRWDQDIASNAIDVHIHYLRRRLSASLIRTVRGVGYVVD
ncbi:MAG TPA: winged-helix domain-containing protein [Ramlibacter sp.]|nr:winged-helix domain-containing protein [Ramlibacter sp.]